MTSKFHLYADTQSIALLEGPVEKILLVGSDFGYGNFGDILQHTNSISFHQGLGRFRTVSIMAANAIGDSSFPKFVRTAYSCDAVVFVSELPLDLTESKLPLKSIPSIRNASALHLYGGGFLNEKWGDFVLGVTEYLLRTLRISTYVVSGQQVTRPYESRVVQHVDSCRPMLFGVRDSLSQQWLDQAGYRADFSFDDAIEALHSLSVRLPVRRGNGLLLHLNVSDYTDNGVNDASLLAELEMLAAHGSSRHGATVLQAYVDQRSEVSDSREAIKMLERAFPFYDYRLMELTALAYQPAKILRASLHGELGYSCSYHVALWLQLAGIPCWLRGNNSFYQQKTSALQVHQDLNSFLRDPYLADHSTNLEQRARWQEALGKVLLEAPESSFVFELSQPEKSTGLLFHFKGAPTLLQRAEAAEVLLQKCDAEQSGLRERNLALNAQLTEVGAIAHDYRLRAEEVEQLRDHTLALEQEVERLRTHILALEQRADSLFASKSWKVTRPLRNISRAISHFIGKNN